jgi:S1-C subfamily serine protease
MELKEATEIKRYLENEFLVKPLNLIKSSSFLEGFQINNYVHTYKSFSGIGIGYEGHHNGYYINIMLREKVKVNLDLMADFFGVAPESFRENYVGKIKPLNTVTKHRPAFPGVSIGHYKTTAGTLGCLVIDEEEKIHILSNNHVLANLNSAKLGDPILQPGPADGGKTKKDTIAELSAYILVDFHGLNKVDAALAEPLDYSFVLPNIPHIGKVAGITSPRLNTRVFKFGRTTRLTSGVITARNATIKVNMGGHEVLFEDQIVIESDHGKFSDGGDSGALIVDLNHRAVGLLFAGSATGATFANPINDVLTLLSVEII